MFILVVYWFTLCSSYVWMGFFVTHELVIWISSMFLNVFSDFHYVFIYLYVMDAIFLNVK